MNCAGCRFGVLDPDDGVIDCHRYPPKVIDTLAGTDNLWPRVDPDEFCGEWQPQPD